MSASLKKLICLGLAIIYSTTQVVLGSVAEGNFWSERKKIQDSNLRQKESVQLAALPAGFNPRLLPQASSIASSIQPLTVSSRTKALLPRGSETLLLPIVRSLPQNVGSIRKISFPDANANRVVIHIQDVHRNNEAQANIQKTLETLLSHNKVDFIGLEGTSGPIDLTRIKKFPDQNIIHRVADYLFQTNDVSGPIYALLTTGHDIPPVQGIDDKVAYDANVTAYRNSVPLMSKIKVELGELELSLRNKKNHFFNKQLLEFDSHSLAYHRMKLSLGDYAKLLVLRTGSTKSLDSFIKALQIESALNFETVNTERSEFITALGNKLDKAEMDELLRTSLAYRGNLISSSDFYHDLNKLSDRKGISPTRFPVLQRYIEYVDLADRIDVDNLLAEIRRKEIAAYSELVSSDVERALVALSQRLEFMTMLTDFALTPDDWKKFNSSDNRYPQVEFSSDELTTLRSKLSSMETKLSPFKSFYQEAQKRDGLMTDNLLKAMESVHSHFAVLVTGGFHATGVDALLNSQGVGTISFVPKLTKADPENGSAYLSSFMQERTPLEKMFQGEKLFLSNDPFLGRIKLPIMVAGFMGEKAQWAFNFLCPSVKALLRLGKLGRRSIELFLIMAKGSVRLEMIYDETGIQSATFRDRIPTRDRVIGRLQFIFHQSDSPTWMVALAKLITPFTSETWKLELLRASAVADHNPASPEEASQLTKAIQWIYRAMSLSTVLVTIASSIVGIHFAGGFLAPGLLILIAPALILIFFEISLVLALFPVQIIAHLIVNVSSILFGTQAAMKKAKVSSDADDIWELMKSKQWDIPAIKIALSLGTKTDFLNYLEEKGLDIRFAKFIQQILIEEKWMNAGVARRLKVSSPTVSLWMQKLKITRPELSRNEVLSILEKNNWDFSKARQELNIKTGVNTLDFIRSKKLESNLKKRLSRILVEEGWSFNKVGKRIGIADFIVADWVEDLGLKNQRFDKIKILKELEKNEWDLSVVKAKLHWKKGEIFLDIFTELDLVDELRAQLLERLNQEDWNVSLVASQFGVDDKVINGWIKKLKLERKALTRNQILKILKETNWNITQAKIKMGLIENWDILAYLIDNGLKDEFKTIISERLTEGGFILSTVAPQFGVTIPPLRKWVKYFGLDKLDRNQILAMLRRNDWRIDKVKKELGFQDSLDFFAEYDLLDDLKIQIQALMSEEGGNKLAVARRLGVVNVTLYNWLSQLFPAGEANLSGYDAKSRRTIKKRLGEYITAMRAGEEDLTEVSLRLTPFNLISGQKGKIRLGEVDGNPIIVKLQGLQGGEQVKFEAFFIDELDPAKGIWLHIQSGRMQWRGSFTKSQNYISVKPVPPGTEKPERISTGLPDYIDALVEGGDLKGPGKRLKPIQRKVSPSGGLFIESFRGRPIFLRFNYAPPRTLVEITPHPIDPATPEKGYYLQISSKDKSWYFTIKKERNYLEERAAPGAQDLIGFIEQLGNEEQPSANLLKEFDIQTDDRGIYFGRSGDREIRLTDTSIPIQRMVHVRPVIDSESPESVKLQIEWDGNLREYVIYPRIPFFRPLVEPGDEEPTKKSIDITDALALLGNDPYRLLQYVRIYYPELSMEQISRIVARGLEGLKPVIEDPYQNYEIKLTRPEITYTSVPLVNGRFETTDTSVVIKGRASLDATHVVIRGAAGGRFRVRPDGTFQAKLPLPRIGEENMFSFFTINKQLERKSHPVEISIFQTGEAVSLDEAFRQLLSLKEEVLQRIKDDPAQQAFVLRSLEISLLKRFTYDEQAGLTYVENLLQEESSPTLKTFYSIILDKFRDISAMKFDLKKDRNGRPQRLYFFQKYVVHEIRRLKEFGVKGVVLALCVIRPIRSVNPKDSGQQSGDSDQVMSPKEQSSRLGAQRRWSC